jgi:ribosomal protein S18 acetylase RimI-like enzyme
MIATADWTIRRLTTADLPPFRTARLDALRLHPQAYGSAYEEEIAFALDDFAARWPAAPGAMFGAFAGDRLIGITGLQVEPRVKRRHKGFIYSVYVDESFRGRGVAAALVEAAIAAARQAALRFVWLSVSVGNEARRTYERLGFQTFGIERRSLLVDGVFVDTELMQLNLD